MNNSQLKGTAVAATLVSVIVLLLPLPGVINSLNGKLNAQSNMPLNNGAFIVGKFFGTLIVSSLFAAPALIRGFLNFKSTKKKIHLSLVAAALVAIAVYTIALSL